MRFAGDLSMLPLLLVLVFIAEVVVDGHQILCLLQRLYQRINAVLLIVPRCYYVRPMRAPIGNTCTLSSERQV